MLKAAFNSSTTLGSVAQVAEEERHGRAEDGGHERRGDGRRARGGARRRGVGGEGDAGEGGHGDGRDDGGVEDLGGHDAAKEKVKLTEILGVLALRSELVGKCNDL